MRPSPPTSLEPLPDDPADRADDGGEPTEEDVGVLRAVTHGTARPWAPRLLAPGPLVRFGHGPLSRMDGWPKRESTEARSYAACRPFFSNCARYRSFSRS